MSVNLNENSDAPLTPAEIDARHARHLLDRALSMIEQGDYNAASLACKQALHLAPQAAPSHAVAGFLALLHENWNEAEEHYELAIENFDEGSTERERLIALQLAESSHTTPRLTALLPNLHGEILRLRQIVRAAPLAAFISETSAPAAIADRKPDTVAASPTQSTPPEPAAPHLRPSVTKLASEEYSSRVGSQLQSSAVAAAVASALIAAILGFILTRSLRSADVAEVPAAPVANEVTSTAMTEVSPAAPETVPPAANMTNPERGNAVTAASTPAPPARTDSTPATAATAPVERRPSPPRAGSDAGATRLPAPASSATRSTPPPASPRLAPHPTPTPGPPFAEPPLPRPRLTLPGVGTSGDDEYTRVVPQPPGARSDDEIPPLPRIGTP